MTRFALLLALSLGLLVACDSAFTTSPDLAQSVALDVGDVIPSIDVQPLGLPDAVIKLGSDQPLTLQVVDYGSGTFFTDFSPTDLRLRVTMPSEAIVDVGPPIHAAQIIAHLDNLDDFAHVTDVDGVYFFKLHFDISALEFAEGDVATMCLVDVAETISYCDATPVVAAAHTNGSGGKNPNW